MTAARARPLLLPDVLRRPAAVAVALAAAVFAVLAVRFAGDSSASRVDLHVDVLLDPAGAADRWLVRATTLLGSPPVVVVLAVALAAGCLRLGRRRLALLAVAGPGVTGLVTTTLKPLIGRTLNGEFAFPSGHTGGATALGLVAALVVIGLVRPGRALGLAILTAGGLLAGAAVGAAMVAINAHYPTDTVGGFCAATVVVLGGALLADHAGRRAGRHPGAGDASGPAS